MRKASALAVGQRSGRLRYCEEIEPSSRTRSLWLCDCGSFIAAQTANVKQGRTRSCGCYRREFTAHRNRIVVFRGADNGKWRGHRIGYSHAHTRVRAARGSATRLACVDCSTPAATWSFDHSTPPARTLMDPRGFPYSTDVNDYAPRCVPCHVRYDLKEGDHREAVLT